MMIQNTLFAKQERINKDIFCPLCARLCGNITATNQHKCYNADCEQGVFRISND
jgi:hypothetical protein